MKAQPLLTAWIGLQTSEWFAFQAGPGHQLLTNVHEAAVPALIDGEQWSCSFPGQCYAGAQHWGWPHQGSLAAPWAKGGGSAEAASCLLRGRGPLPFCRHPAHMQGRGLSQHGPCGQGVLPRRDSRASPCSATAFPCNLGQVPQGKRAQRDRQGPSRLWRQAPSLWDLDSIKCVSRLAWGLAQARVPRCPEAACVRRGSGTSTRCSAGRARPSHSNSHGHSSRRIPGETGRATEQTSSGLGDKNTRLCTHRHSGGPGSTHH